MADSTGPVPPKRSGLWPGTVAVCALLFATACDGETVTLGSGDPSPFQFGAATPVPGLDTSVHNDNPTLTGDLLELVFTSSTQELWYARRTSIFQPFDPPQPMTAMNTAGFESSPALSLDGLTLWFASDRTGGMGGLDIWVTTRASRTSAWDTPRPVPGLNSPGRELPRSMGMHGTVMPMASDRAVTDVYWTYLATRTGDPSQFDAPQKIAALSSCDRNVVDGHLTDDGLALLFTSGTTGSPGDLFVVQRPTTAHPFTAPQAIDSVNTAADERDPWLSPDGMTLFFVSNRDGNRNIYVAYRIPP